ncbi:hypothetical protein APSETT445_003308 [Aspergillus pseudonomiae]
MARPCKNCGAPRAEDVPDEIELCEQCTARDAPVASFDSQAGSPTEPSTPVPATQSNGYQGDDIHSGQGREAVDLDEPVLVPDPGSVLVGCGPCQVGMGTSPVAPMPAAPLGSALNDGNRLKRKASALGVEEPILDIEHDQSVENAFQQETQRPLQPKESGETSQDDPAHDDPGEESSKRAGLRPKSQPGATRVGRIPPKPRGRPRKQPEEIQAVVDEGNAVEEPESPPRRPRRGRRPAQRMGTSAEGKRGQATVPEPAAAAVPAETMAANLSIASNMALNNILAEDFQDTVRDCGEKWQTVSDSLREAMDSFHEAKHKIDTWLEMWRRGEV